MTSMRISTQAAGSCSATPCCSIPLSHPLPPCVKMMTPSVISQGSAPDTTRHRESLFFPPLSADLCCDCCIVAFRELLSSDKQKGSLTGESVEEGPWLTALLGMQNWLPFLSDLSLAVAHTGPAHLLISLMGSHRGRFGIVRCDSNQASLWKLRNNGFDYRNLHNSEVLELHLHFLLRWMWPQTYYIAIYLRIDLHRSLRHLGCQYFYLFNVLKLHYTTFAGHNPTLICIFKLVLRFVKIWIVVNI